MKGDYRIVLVMLGAWATALLCVFVEEAAWWWLAASASCAAVVALLLVLRGGHGRAARFGPVAVVVLAVAAAVAVSVGSADSSRDAAAEFDGRVVEAAAVVSSSASTGADGRLWFDAQLSSLGPPGAMTAVSAPVRVGVDPAAGYDLGAEVRLTGQVIATGAGERAALVVFATESRVATPASGVFAVAAALKSEFVERALRLPEPGAALLPGLAVGDTRAVEAELDADMRASGLSHLTAVSGANCAIVVGAAFWAVSLCGGARGLRIVAAGISLAGFVVLVTPEPSVIRAAVMAGVSMLAVLLGRPSAGAGLLAASASGIIVADPWLAATPGFALSVAASGALILLARPLARGLGRWMPEPLALAVGVPLAAQLVCGPIIALFAEQQSLIGVPANLLAAPAAPVATVIGLLACLAAPLPVIADVLAASAWLPATWIATTAQVSADIPVGRIALPAGVGSAALVALVSAAVGLLLVGSARSTASARSRSLVWIRAAAVVVVAVMLGLGGARAALDGPLATAATPSGWSLAACDVGQGDAIVVRSEGRTALVDTGPDPGLLDSCLRGLGVERIDLLVLTHFDLDHVGGLEAVRGRVERVLHGPPVDSGDERLLAELAAGGASIGQAAAGLRGAIGGAAWTVLWPRPGSAAFPSGNDASVILEVEGGGVPRSILLGDLSESPQRMLASAVRPGRGYAVVKVAHHGSADQDAGLYERLRPVAALISVGEGNDYGHPRRETLDLLVGAGAEVLRTDERGRILLGLRDGALEVWTERSVGGPG
ncbi:ComEC/Rec2 family competence protein [Streptomyces sp. AC495_CC817]|uniref:ComEC/Rec2 family competence protein n=1 Tax=Streptomyces sp. AC495_CC817 TaxID=2823900 RepID=UPI001C278398|nr:ComEC/Rec2 family competence protein [Streptomyces sp. AC495_CC817]